MSGIKCPAWVKSLSEEIASASQFWENTHEANEKAKEIILRYVLPAQELPQELAGHPGFMLTYQEWCLYLRERNRGKVIPSTTVKKHIGQFGNWGPEASIASMEQSMQRNWTGLFSVEGKYGNRPATPAKTYQEPQDAAPLFP